MKEKEENEDLALMPIPELKAFRKADGLLGMRMWRPCVTSSVSKRGPVAGVCGGTEDSTNF